MKPSSLDEKISKLISDESREKPILKTVEKAPNIIKETKEFDDFYDAEDKDLENIKDEDFW